MRGAVGCTSGGLKESCLRMYLMSCPRMYLWWVEGELPQDVPQVGWRRAASGCTSGSASGCTSGGLKERCLRMYLMWCLRMYLWWVKREVPQDVHQAVPQDVPRVGWRRDASRRASRTVRCVVCTGRPASSSPCDTCRIDQPSAAPATRTHSKLTTTSH